MLTKILRNCIFKRASIICLICLHVLSCKYEDNSIKSTSTNTVGKVWSLSESVQLLEESDLPNILLTDMRYATMSKQISEFESIKIPEMAENSEFYAYAEISVNSSIYNFYLLSKTEEECFLAKLERGVKAVVHYPCMEMDNLKGFEGKGGLVGRDNMIFVYHIALSSKTLVNVIVSPQLRLFNESNDTLEERFQTLSRLTGVN